MKNLIIILSAACAVVAGYFVFRHFTRRNLGFTAAIRNLADNLLHTEITAAREAGVTHNTTTEQAA